MNGSMATTSAYLLVYAALIFLGWRVFVGLVWFALPRRLRHPNLVVREELDKLRVQLETLRDLHREGLLSDDAFQKSKSKLMQNGA